MDPRPPWDLDATTALPLQTPQGREREKGRKGWREQGMGKEEWKNGKGKLVKDGWWIKARKKSKVSLLENIEIKG